MIVFHELCRTAQSTRAHKLSVMGHAYTCWYVDGWRNTYFGKNERGALWLLIYGALKIHMLT